MATLQIPTRTDLAIYSISVDLEGETFKLDFQFNEREGFWYFDLMDVDEVLIRAGVKVVTGWSLTRLISDARRPPGEITIIDTADLDREAGIEDLGTEVLMLYAEAEDVAAAVG